MLRLTWLGHSTVVIDIGDVRLITDPLLHRHAPPLLRVGPRPARAAWQDTDAVLLSHLHLDHAELRSMRLLGQVPVLTAAANAEWLHRKKISTAVALDDEWYHVGESAVQVRLVPAVHKSRPMPHRPNAVNGHLVRGTDGVVVWAVGDTETFAAMRELGSWAGGRLTVALMPIGGWGPRLSPGHLDPEEAAAACALADPEWVLPVHWGTLHAPGQRHLPRHWMERPLAAFADALKRVAPRSRLISSPRGETWELSASNDH